MSRPPKWKAYEAYWKERLGGPWETPIPQELLPKNKAEPKTRGPRRSVKQRELARSRAGGVCEVDGCGYSTHTAVHHRTPFVCGGSDDLGNLVVLCPNHHAAAHAIWRSTRRMWP